MTVSFAVDAHRADPPRDDILRLWSAFAPLEMGLRSRVLRDGQITQAPQRSIFQASGEIGVVVQGCLIQHIDKTLLCSGVAGPGDVVDLTGGPGGRWLSPGEVYQISLSAFFSHTGEEGMRFLFSASERRRKASERRLACAMAHSATARVASLLVEISAACATSQISLCQAKLADLLCLRRTSVNAACKLLKQAGALRTVRGRTIILDRARLISASCCTTDRLSCNRTVAEHFPPQAEPVKIPLLPGVANL